MEVEKANEQNQTREGLGRDPLSGKRPCAFAAPYIEVDTRVTQLGIGLGISLQPLVDLTGEVGNLARASFCTR